MTVLHDHDASRVNMELGGLSFRAERIMVVKVAAGVAAHEILYEAIDDPGVPNVYDSWPVFGDTTQLNLVVSGIRAEPMYCDTSDNRWLVRVTVTYQRPAGASAPPDNTAAGVIEVGASAVEQQTNFDTGGTQITVEHTFTDGRGTVTQGGAVTTFLAKPVIRVQRKETTSPQLLAEQYVGKVNDALFNGRAIGTVLCTKIAGVSEDQGETFVVTYEFAIDAAGWQPEVVFIDEKTGTPPPALVSGTGYKTVTAVDSENFSLLNVVF